MFRCLSSSWRALLCSHAAQPLVVPIAIAGCSYQAAIASGIGAVGEIVRPTVRGNHGSVIMSAKKRKPRSQHDGRVCLRYSGNYTRTNKTVRCIASNNTNSIANTKNSESCIAGANTTIT